MPTTSTFGYLNGNTPATSQTDPMQTVPSRRSRRTESRKIADDVISTAWRSRSVLIGDAARAFRRIAPMAFAEVSTHALVTHHASDQVTAAARQAYMHQPPPIRPLCFAGLLNPRTDACGGKAVCHRWGRAYRCVPLGHRALMRACTLCGGNRHRALTHACALRCLGVGSGNGCLESGSSLGFHRRRLHRHRHSRRRCGCVVLKGTDGLRGDSHRVGRRHIDAVRVIGTNDEDRCDGSHKELAGPEQAPARSQRRGGEQRLRHGCRDGYVAWCCPRRRRVSG